MNKPLDADTEKHVTSVIKRALHAGANIPARLNEAGLLLTKAREKGVREEALERLLTEFQVWLPHEFLRLVNRELTGCTPADMYHAIHKWLGDYIDTIKKLG